MKYKELTTEEKYIISVMQRNFSIFTESEKKDFVRRVEAYLTDDLFLHINQWLNDDYNFQPNRFNSDFGYAKGTKEIAEMRDLFRQNTNHLQSLFLKKKSDGRVNNQNQNIAQYRPENPREKKFVDGAISLSMKFRPDTVKALREYANEFPKPKGGYNSLVESLIRQHFGLLN